MFKIGFNAAMLISSVFFFFMFFSSFLSRQKADRTREYSENLRLQKKLPHAIVIGVKKGGTRALLEFLRIHPDVGAPGPEVHFFDKRYGNGLEWYRQQMPSTLSDQLTIEKTPSYFVMKDVPRRVYEMSPSVKLIVVVRDPVTRAISDYTQQLSKRPNIQSFEKFVFVDDQSKVINSSWAAIRIGIYAKHLRRWLDYFSLAQIHFVNGERLVTDPAGQLAKVESFLGLRPIIKPSNFYYNETKGFPCLRKSGESIQCLGKTKGRIHPTISEEVVERLRAFFRPFNERFYRMTGRNFGWS
ncbi:DgyrCDS13227 [Dimorphilus gyrociliatus]|uniref:DgyrCDS13227 n=1 Tax=Dimorphilus gyrociliatus TaxID=2664684 RepID=A0A7I8WA48_9ANNE|nr:DgyrCDS13227 [Dimorphilus gyrociliatus]